MVVDQGSTDTLFNFSAVPGDHWYAPDLPWPTSVPCRYVVTDTGTTVVSTVPLRWVSVDAYFEIDGPPVFFFSDTLVERIGFIGQYVIPQLSLSLEPDIHGLRCYTDEDLEFSTGIAPECSYIVTVQEEVREASVLITYPNPARGSVTIAHGLPVGPMSAITLRDMIGRKLADLPVSSFTEQTTIDLSGYVPGPYTVEFMTNGKPIGCVVLIIEP
jgi:hypothetical protein